MTEPKVTVYGAYWCPDCRRSKKFLGEQFIPYRWVDIEQDKDGEAFVLEKNDGKRIIPTIVFEDGSFLVEPTNAELAKKLGIKTEAQKIYYDLIIVGGGPAGLTASIYAAREGIDTLLIERSGLGGQAGITVGLDNFPGFPEGISGQEFSERVAQQAKRFGVELLQAVDVERLDMEAGYHEVYASDGKPYHSCAVLLATGACIKGWVCLARTITSARASISARRAMVRFTRDRSRSWSSAVGTPQWRRDCTSPTLPTK